MLLLILRTIIRVFFICLGGVMLVLLMSQRLLPPVYPDLEQYGILACQLPCTAGILPGRTPSQDVQTRLLAHIPALEAIQIYSPGSINFSAMYRGRTVTGNVGHRGDRVTVIAFSSLLLPLDYLIAQIGEPDCVEYIAAAMGTEGLVLYWQWDTIAAATILIDSPANALHHNGRTTDWRVTLEKTICRGKLAWRGAQPLWKYAQTMTEFSQ